MNVIGYIHQERKMCFFFGVILIIWISSDKYYPKAKGKFKRVYMTSVKSLLCLPCCAVLGTYDPNQ